MRKVQFPIAIVTGVLTLALVAGACSSSSGSGTAAGSNGSSGSTSADGSSPPTGAGGRPNVLFVLTDDMRLDDLQFMPNVRSLIGDQGMSFDQHFDNVTLCCPARTSILRGQYSHNTGILTNGGNNGGFETAFATKVEGQTVATALHDAGYATGLFGKYLNGYPNTAGASYVPPGWDTWSSSSKGNAYGEYDYTLNQNGTQVAYGHTSNDYGTDVYMRQTKDFITKAQQAGQPFFAYLAVYAPHQPATPAPQDVDAFPGLQAPRDPAYDEADVNDKPQYIKDLPPLSQREQRQIDRLYRLRAQSLQAVDRGVAGLVDQLRATGQLDSTYIVFTSDNGFHLGQHRMQAGKQTAYETDIHLPLLVRGPGVTAGSHTDAITGNIDLAPTFAAMAGTKLADAPDGRSLLPLLDTKPGTPAASDPGTVSAPSGWRQAFLLEHWTSSSEAPRPGAAQLEPEDLDQGGAAPGAVEGGGSTTTTENKRKGAAALTNIPEFQGLRVAGYAYVEYSTGERELYDLRTDPDELNNLASAKPAIVDQLHTRLESLRRCAAETCQQAESEPLSLS